MCTRDHPFVACLCGAYTINWALEFHTMRVLAGRVVSVSLPRNQPATLISPSSEIRRLTKNPRPNMEAQLERIYSSRAAQHVSQQRQLVQHAAVLEHHLDSRRRKIPVSLHTELFALFTRHISPALPLRSYAVNMLQCSVLVVLWLGKLDAHAPIG